MENIELAAALLFMLGEPVPHDPALEEKADSMIRTSPGRGELLLKAATLCGERETPRQLYLRAKIYSWLGKTYCRKTIHYASEYLKTPGWDALSRKGREENGVWVDEFQKSRAEIYMILASAQEMAEELAQAFSNYEEAYYLTPYNAMCAIQCAEVLKRMRSPKEALDYLIRQKSSIYYEPVLYRDAAGKLQRNGFFRQLIDAHILKLSGAVGQPEKAGRKESGKL